MTYLRLPCLADRLQRIIISVPREFKWRRAQGGGRVPLAPRPAHSAPTTINSAVSIVTPGCTTVCLLANDLRGEARQPSGMWPSGTSGSARSRTPVAAKIALARTGAIAMIGVSPPPVDGRSRRIQEDDLDRRQELIENIREIHPDTPVVLTSPGLNLGWEESTGRHLVTMLQGQPTGARLHEAIQSALEPSADAKP